MKKVFYVFLFISTLLSCGDNFLDNKESETKKNNLGGLIENNPESITSLEKYMQHDANNDVMSIEFLDSLQTSNELEIYEYQNLTSWGGLDIYYYKGVLVKVVGTYNGELGSFSNYYYFTNRKGKLSKIINNQIFGNIPANILVDNIGVVNSDKSLDRELVQHAINDANSLLQFIKNYEVEIKRDSKLKKD